MDTGATEINPEASWHIDMLNDKDRSKMKFVKLCVKALGTATASIRPDARSLDLSVEEEREMWRKVLQIVITGGGKYDPAA